MDSSGLGTAFMDTYDCGELGWRSQVVSLVVSVLLNKFSQRLFSTPSGIKCSYPQYL